MNNPNFKKKDKHSNSFKKWLPAIFFALTIHVLLVALLLYTNNTKKNTELTNNKINQPDLPATLAAELKNTSINTNTINSHTNKNGIPSTQTIALNNSTQINKQNNSSGSTAKPPKENTQTPSRNTTNANLTNKPTNDSKLNNNKNNAVINQPATKTKSHTPPLFDTNSSTKTDASVSKTINNSAADNMISKTVKEEASQDKGNAILIEGIDTPKNEAINTVKDQLVDTNQQVEKLDEQNNKLKEEVAEIHTQTTSKIEAIIKYNQQIIEQNNQQQKLEFEQNGKLGQPTLTEE